MGWTDFALARRLIHEQRHGTALRAARKREEALARKNAEALKKQERNGPRRDG
jgi:hypothetical protein